MPSLSLHMFQLPLGVQLQHQMQHVRKRLFIHHDDLVHKSNDVVVLARLRQKQFYWTIRPKKTPHFVQPQSDIFEFFHVRIYFEFSHFGVNLFKHRHFQFIIASVNKTIF